LIADLEAQTGKCVVLISIECQYNPWMLPQKVPDQLVKLWTPLLKGVDLLLGEQGTFRVGLIAMKQYQIGVAAPGMRANIHNIGTVRAEPYARGEADLTKPRDQK